MEQKNLEVGLLLWWNGESKAQPIVISYLNPKKNCFRFITFSDNKETENLHLIKKGKPSHLLEEMSKTDTMKVYEYLSKRKNDAQNKVNTSLNSLNESLRQHGFAVQKVNDEVALEENIKKTLLKFEEKLSEV
jgi:hypothetical protein